MQGPWAPQGMAYTQIVHCTGFFCLTQKDLFLSTGHGGGSASLESIRNSHNCKQNRNGCNSDSTFFENSGNIFSWYSKPFSASDQGGTVEREEYFCKVCWLKVLWKYCFTHLSFRLPLHNQWQLQWQRREQDLLSFRYAMQLFLLKICSLWGRYILEAL